MSRLLPYKVRSGLNLRTHYNNVETELPNCFYLRKVRVEGCGYGLPGDTESGGLYSYLWMPPLLNSRRGPEYC